MTPYIQFMVDIETRAKYDNGVITRLAITPFKFDETDLTFNDLLDRTLYIAINQNEQLNRGRIIEQETEEFWNKQSEELRIESCYSTPNDLSVVDAFAEAKRFLSRWRYDYINSFLWARNSGFECFKLMSLNEQFIPNTKQVFNNWRWHEVKTFNYIFTGGETDKYKVDNEESLGFQYHNAKHDAALDALRLLELWKKTL